MFLLTGTLSFIFWGENALYLYVFHRGSDRFIYSIFLDLSLYFIFMFQVYSAYFHTDINIRMVMLYMFVPLVLICWIPNLKLLVPFSTIANLVTAISFLIIFYYIFNDIPSIDTRKPVGTMKGIPLFFGTVLFAMEAIGVVSISFKNLFMSSYLRSISV